MVGLQAEAAEVRLRRGVDLVGVEAAGEGGRDTSGGSSNRLALAFIHHLSHNTDVETTKRPPTLTSHTNIVPLRTLMSVMF